MWCLEVIIALNKEAQRKHDEKREEQEQKKLKGIDRILAIRPIMQRKEG